MMSRQSLRQALVEQKNVMSAVILRDLRTRFFNHGLGFLVVPLFPFLHLLALLVIYSVFGRESVYGDDLNIFLSTALIPTLTFMYASRFISYSLLANRQMITYPVVNVLDVIFARAFLEILAAVHMAVAVFAVLYAVGSNPFPHDPVGAFTAFAATLFLSVAAGIVVSILCMFFEIVATLWALSLILFYMASGFFYVPSFLPEPVIRILSWNPVLHCTEWMRVAYYPGYPDQVLDKSYVISASIFLLIAGLCGERFLRVRLLSN